MYEEAYRSHGASHLVESTKFTNDPASRIIAWTMILAGGFAMLAGSYGLGRAIALEIPLKQMWLSPIAWVLGMVTVIMGFLRRASHHK